MMGTYDPFPIYDLRTGLELDREPWLLPGNAFQVADNVYFYKGRIFKRKGYSAFGQSTGGSGVTTLVTPPVMGIYNYFTTGGASYLIAFDKDFLYQYSPTDDDWVPKGGYPTPDFTGTDQDFFWCEVIPKGQLGAATDLLLITNNVDTMKTWNGSALANITGTNVPQATLFAVIHKNRLITLNTVEGGDRFPQRARCSNVGTYSNFSEDIYVDADTVDWITGVSFVRGELLVWFERSAWWLRYTGNASTPFAWKQIDETEGIYGPYSVVNFEGESIGLGATSLVGCDGLRVYSVTEKLPELILNMNPQALQYSYGFIAEELSQYLMAYASQGKEACDKMLCLNYKDNAFSIYSLANFHSMGYWTQADSWTLDDVTVTMDEMTWAFDDKTLVAGYPILIMGDQSGKTWKLFLNDADNASNIVSQLKTKKMVPYEGYGARLGYIDFYGDSGENLTFTVKLYKDSKSVPYKTATVSMYEAGKDKTWQRIRVMEECKSSHVIEIYDNSKNNPWALDAIIPWFKRSGRRK